MGWECMEGEMGWYLNQAAKRKLDMAEPGETESRRP